MNLLKLIAIPRTTVPLKDVPITGALLDEIETLKPGQIMTLKDKHGREYGLLHLDDLEHVLAKAGLRLADNGP